MRTNKIGRVLAALWLSAAALSISACEHEGPAERTGKEIDRAAEKAGDKIEDAGDKVKDAVD
jgi:hypothetical protein